MNTLDYAKKYSELGFSVIPLQPVSKTPLSNFKLEQYFSQHPTETDLINWFGSTPNNIGIITGNISKLFALDVDGEEAKKYLQSKFDSLSASLQSAITNTMANRTGNGIHLLFRYDPSEFAEGVKTQKLWLGKGEHSEIAIKGKNGYIVAPPSIHPDTKQPYELASDNIPILLTRRELSELIEIIGNERKRQGPSTTTKTTSEEYTNALTPEKMAELLKEITPFYTKGQRDHFVFVLTGYLRKSGIPLDNTERFISLLAEKTHDDEHHSRLIVVRSTYEKPIDQIVGYTGLLEIISLQTDKETALKVLKRIQEIVEPNTQENKERKKESKADEVRQLVLEIADYMESLYTFKTISENDEILYYQKGVFKPHAEIIIKTEVQKKYREFLTRNAIDEVLAHIRRDTYVSKNDFDTDIDLINTSTGFYRISTAEFIPHGDKPPVINGKEYLSLNQKKIVYNPKAKPKRWGQFLKEVLYPGEIRTAMEAMAYSFYRDNPIEAYFILVGIGRNGKSVFTRVLTELLGRENTSNVPMSTIQADPRFAISDMENKDANIDTELSGATIKDMAIIKRITTRQPFRIERKNQRAYDTTLTAKLWFNTNKIPETNDDSDAHYAREIIISFPHQFVDGKNADPNLIAKLTTEEELSGIFNALMTALRTVLKRGSIYQQVKTIEERREKAKRAMNPIKAFIGEGLAEDSTIEDKVIKADMYEAYLIYCKYYNLHFEKDNVFARILKDTYNIKDGRQHNGERKTYWTGIKVADWLVNEVYKVTTKQATLTP